MIIEVVGKEIEKIKGDFESYLNGLNMVGEISYSQYSELYDEGTKQIQRAYELGKSELENENAELQEKLEGAEKARDYWKDSSFDWRHKCTSRKPFKVAVKAQKQLKKAMKHLKDLVYVVELGKNELATARILAEAKEFLKEE